MFASFRNQQVDNSTQVTIAYTPKGLLKNPVCIFPVQFNM
jgi:hypothetical protein